MVMALSVRRRLSFALPLVLAAFSMAGVDAEEAPPAQQQQQGPAATSLGQKGAARGGGAAQPAPTEVHKLPPDSTTRQTLELPGRTLSFAATAGSIRLFDDKGEPEADIVYTAYQLDGAERTTRPVTFVFNGGPGAASAWLQLGNNGPWRLAINADSVTPSASPELQANAETWLDFTDLVYIDPVGTGYSRFVSTNEDVRKRLFSVDGDVEAVSVTIRRHNACQHATCTNRGLLLRLLGL